MQDRAQPTRAKFTHAILAGNAASGPSCVGFCCSIDGPWFEVNKAGCENVANLQDEDTPRDRSGKSCELHAGARICAS